MLVNDEGETRTTDLSLSHHYLFCDIISSTTSGHRTVSQESVLSPYHRLHNGKAAPFNQTEKLKKPLE